MKTEKTEKSSKEFDPHYNWLGIPPKSQPPTHYRLLGLEQFENNQHAIDAASGRLVRFLQDISTGSEHVNEAQELINQIARARVCLLNPTAKQAYDQQLKQSSYNIRTEPVAHKRLSSSSGNSSTNGRRNQQLPLVWMILATVFSLYGIAVTVLLLNSSFSSDRSKVVLQKDTGPQQMGGNSHDSTHENQIDSDNPNEAGKPRQNTPSEPDSQSVPGGIPKIASEHLIGPMIGHVGPTFANILFRPDNVPCQLKLTLIDDEGEMVGSDTTTTSSENDFVAKFRVDGLQADTVYRYRIERLDNEKPVLLVGELEEHFFQTASDSRSDKKVTISFVSCVDNKPNSIWPEMERLEVDMLCLMGDTPYIDTSDLDTVRAKHRSFLQIPDVASVTRHTSTVGTWDDHDFGQNNGNGSSMMQGKTETRQGFVEYRAHEKYGTGTEGVYHKVDRGMIEVFMLDPRYFSQTEASPVDPNQPTCFGQSQWKWLLKSLKASQAPFKVLAMGAIWQDKKKF